MDRDSHLLQVILFLHVIGAIVLIYGLWFKKESVLKKVFWSLVMLVPVIGPVLYLAFFKIPPALPIHRQNKDRAGSHGTGKQNEFRPQKIIDFFTKDK